MQVLYACALCKCSMQVLYASALYKGSMQVLMGSAHLCLLAGPFSGDGLVCRSPQKGWAQHICAAHVLYACALCMCSMQVLYASALCKCSMQVLYAWADGLSTSVPLSRSFQWGWAGLQVPSERMGSAHLCGSCALCMCSMHVLYASALCKCSMQVLYACALCMCCV
jgi:hypothetical protein